MKKSKRCGSVSGSVVRGTAWGFAGRMGRRIGWVAGLAWVCAGGRVLAAEAPPAAVSALPLSSLVLYSSGVGYFERHGKVEGRADVELRFRTEDINDLLKSMVVRDLSGGSVSRVTYDSRDPLTKTLKSFGLDLTDNPTYASLLNQLRGERVEIAWPNRVVATLLGVEQKQQTVERDRVVQVDYLNVVSDSGLQSIPLAQVQSLRLLKPGLNQELAQALAVLASGHDTEKKTVVITFDGQGRREVSVAYVTQTPVWKTTYRLVLADDQAPYLQGWALVENTSDEDWLNLRLSLVSGRPISFVMDLYEPLYSQRPEVELEAYASLRPQVYGDALDAAGAPEAEGAVQAAAASGARELAAARYGMLRSAKTAAVPAAPMALAADTAAVTGEDSPRGGRPAKLRSEELTPSAAQGVALGELFEYQIQAPVTLARQKSAMLPIVGQQIAGERVSIYNRAAQPKHPLYGFRLKNTTDLHLLQGPITVFENGAYAGDARIEDLAPGQDRLISYGLDLKAEVDPQAVERQSEWSTVTIRRGAMVITRRWVEGMTYVVRNRDRRAKTVLLEHPYRAEWQLLEPNQKAERSRDVYRFSIMVPADGVSKWVVREEKTFDEQIQISNASSDTIGLYARGAKVSERVKNALNKVAQLRDQISKTAGDRRRREQRVAEISQEQARLRENMARLQNTSELYIRYVKKLDQQETDLEGLRQEIESLKTREQNEARALDEFLSNLKLD